LAETLVAAGADLLLCETFAHLGEATVAVEESVRTGSETWLAFTAGPEGILMQPSEMADGARRVVDAGASAVLVNCTPAEETLPFVDALADAKLGVPIGAYANSGSLGWQSADPEFTAAYASAAQRWVNAGATLIGGCCGTTPAHISAITKVLT
jgi:S-methylmethionine-dependent homocysteine/selenocysteine methylase